MAEMNASIELQVLSFLLTSQDTEAVNTLLDFDTSYYELFKSQIKFIQNHVAQTGKVPDTFTFNAQYPDVPIIRVDEPLDWLIDRLKENKKRICLIGTLNKVKDLGADDASDAWEYIGQQYDMMHSLDSSQPMDIIHDADKRIQQVLEFSQQTRIPTGFDEIDKAMYGGLSTVEELLLLVARTGNGKSWVCTKMMETATKNGFHVAYYSPEMQASYLATRFDTWRGHFANSQIFIGQYSDDYLAYIEQLKQQSSNAFVIEDKDVPDGAVTVPYLKKFVKKNNIKELIIDGLSYMVDVRSKHNDTDYVKYKNICEDLLRLSKECGCAVAVVVQANRATKESKDDKGQPFPTIYNIEGSDHPARIATQIFAMRQIFEKHILDIRLEKARNAQNQKPVFSYSWDINTGNVSRAPNEEDMPTVTTPVVNSGMEIPDISYVTAGIGYDIDDVVEVKF